MAVPDQDTVNTLLEKVGEGKSCIVDQVDVARSLEREGRASNAMKALASLGADHGRNVERDLHRWVEGLLGRPVQPYYLHLKLESNTSFELEDVDVPVIPPYEFAHILMHFDEAQFRRSFLDPEGPSCLEFWTYAKTTEWGKAHIALQGASDEKLSKMLPIVWHMDGFEVHSNAEHYAWSCESILSSSDLWECKLPVAIIPHRRMQLKQTRKKVFKVMAEFIGFVMRIWCIGLLPPLGFYNESLHHRALEPNTEIARGWTTAFAGLKGDAKARREMHNYKRHYNSTFLCEDCLACQWFKNAPKHLYYGDFGDGAFHKKTRISHDVYVASELQLTPWLSVPGWHKSLNYRDLLHDVWIGFGKDVAASSINECLKEKLFGEGSTDRCLKRLTIIRDRWCKKQGISKVPLAFTQCNCGLPGTSTGGEKKKKYAELSSQFKGMHVKVICKFLASFLHRLPQPDVHAKIRAACLWSLVDFFHVLDHAGLILDDAQVARASRAGKLFLQSYQWLAGNAARAQRTDWHLRPKLHSFDHVVDNLQNRLNPVKVQCAGDETYMGILKKVGRRCHGSNTMLRTLQRVVLGMSLRFRRYLALMQSPI